MAEYQTNSHRSKELESTAKTNGKKVEKVVTGSAKTKKNELRKFTDVFISDDARNVKSYVIMDVLVPAIKKAISDIVTDGIDMVLYGGDSRRSSRRSGSSRVSYRDYYDDPRSSRDSRSRSDYSRPGRFDYEDIIFNSRGDAERVREQMMDLIDTYTFVTVADMYDMADLTAPHTANKYGWINIRNSEVVRVKGDGYVIKLPRAMPID